MIEFLNDYHGFAEHFGKEINDLFPEESFSLKFLPFNLEHRLANADNTPFASYSKTGDSPRQIVYNNSLIANYNLSDSEIWACIAHEIGHIIRQDSLDTDNDPLKESKCDSFAAKLNLQFYMASALVKIQALIKEDKLDVRLERLSKAINIYRPEWTCGRYNTKKQAIYYNLIDGMSYHFSFYSADFMGHILSLGRNGHDNLWNIAEKTGLSPLSVIPFVDMLVTYGLLTLKLWNEADIADYQKSVIEGRRSRGLASASILDRMSIDESDAEILYSDAVDDGATITSVMFELTYNCSERCIHCYNPGATRNAHEISYRANRNELTIDEYKSIIDQLYELGLIKVCLTGGDPFSKPIVWDIIKYLYEKDIAIDIYTNGQRLMGNEANLAKYYPRLVGLSLYSGVATDHDKITSVTGSWKRTMSVLSALSSYAIPINLKCCVMQPNVRSYYMVSDIAMEYGAMPQYELSITESNDGDLCAKKLRLNETQLKVVLRDLQVPLYVGPSAKDYGRVQKKMDTAPCGTGRTSFCITPDGDLRGCCAFPMTYGNIRDGKIIDTIVGNKIIEDWRNIMISDYTECGRYDYCSFCNLCSGNNYLEHGDYRKPAETNCYLAKCRCKLAAELSDNDASDLPREDLIRELQKLTIESVSLHREYRTGK